ncbi:FAD-binding oxidoreductase [Pseudorhodobacter sp. MZDSW-24AT]|uniref:NAD(P)/FAD-dependent oxidoreductase n=1 Tax=Pseudorhodobacter sp. MZDSW-24AT TaxID=2052957 RepID=UPI000C1E3547|nr:FAD-binding oxidoreductase [Pseudorhodobacter sp. MZDSW-24AT]PJF09221.1 D-amino-acid oxidase [Pseudorhodobacter sp. MZDSW-24AT]
MHPNIDPVPSDDRLPAQADLVVIGGGIIGCAAALWAAEQGLRVVILEKGRIGAEQSGRNWGWVRRMGRARAEYPLGIASLRLWDGLNARTGHDTGFRRSGIVYGGTTPAEHRWLDTVAQDARDFGIDLRRLGPADMASLFPGATLGDLSGVLSADDGRAEPALATAAIAKGARKHGAQIFTACAARGLETSTGHVSAVVTERGRILTHAVILAAGAWSRLFAGALGLNLPQLRIRASVLRTGPVAGGPRLTLGTGRFGLRPRLDGGYTIALRGRSRVQITPDAFRLLPQFLPGLRQNLGDLSLTLDHSLWQGLTTPRRWPAEGRTPFETARVLDPKPQSRSLSAALRAVTAAFPAFRGVPVAERWGGIIDVTPDGVPIIDHAPGLPGLVIATGFSGHGFGIGPTSGQLAAELAIGAAPLVDAAPFALARFRLTQAPTLGANT